MFTFVRFFNILLAISILSSAISHAATKQPTHKRKAPDSTVESNGVETGETGHVSRKKLYTEFQARMQATQERMQAKKAVATTTSEKSSKATIAIKFNPSLNDGPKVPRLFNTVKEVYDAYGIKEEYSSECDLKAFGNQDKTKSQTNLDLIESMFSSSLIEDNASRVTALRIDRFKNLMPLWIKSICSPRQTSFSFHEQEGPKSDFSISNELVAISKKEELATDTNSLLRADQSHKEIILSKIDTPKLFHLVEKLTATYEMDMPLILLCNNHRFPVAMGRMIREDNSTKANKPCLRIDCVYIQLFTNDEIEVLLAHELAHEKYEHHN
jgi:hypothetical protein